MRGQGQQLRSKEIWQGALCTMSSALAVHALGRGQQLRSPPILLGDAVWHLLLLASSAAASGQLVPAQALLHLSSGCSTTVMRRQVCGLESVFGEGFGKGFVRRASDRALTGTLASAGYW